MKNEVRPGSDAKAVQLGTPESANIQTNGSAMGPSPATSGAF